MLTKGANDFGVIGTSTLDLTIFTSCPPQPDLSPSPQNESMHLGRHEINIIKILSNL